MKAATKRITKQINWKAIFRIHGFLMIVTGVAMLLPLAVSIFHHGPDTESFAISSGVTMLAGAIVMYVNRSHRGIPMGKREGCLLTATVWLVLSAFGMLPFMIGKPSLGVTDAFFESMSGFTTTGASLITNYENFSNAMLLWRSMMQWIGGMGIIIFTVALLPMLNSSGGLQMFNAESTGFTKDKIAPRVSSTAKRLYSLYILLTAIAAGLLWLGPMNLFDSICHAMSTLSTGGFSTNAEGLNHWHSPYINAVVLVFMFVGSVNFVVIYRILHGQIKQAWRNETLRAFVAIIIVVTLIFIGVGLRNHVEASPLERVLDPLFNVVSTISSTGYEVGRVAGWGGPIVPILLLLMLVGGCAGSTSGGLKIDRIVYLWKNCRIEMYRIVHPNRYYALTFDGRPTPPEVMAKVIAFVLIYILLIFVTSIVLSVLGMGTGQAFIASITCIGNSCSSTEIVNNAYSAIPEAGKWILALLMMIGRLELFTVLVLFTTTFWRRG